MTSRNDLPCPTNLVSPNPPEHSGTLNDAIHKTKRRHPQKQIPKAKHRPPYGHNRVQNQRTKTKRRYTILLNNRVKLCILPSTTPYEYTKTLQFQHIKRKCHRKIQIQNWFLRTNRYAGNIPKKKWISH